MPTTRRLFLQQLGTAGIVSLAGLPPRFLCRAVQAAETPATSGRILVLAQLAGGNDGLNTVVPYASPDYYKARPGIAIPKQAVLKLNDQLGLHPAMTGFKELYDEGWLTVVQGVGYPHPDRSHFRSMDIWQSARPEVEDTRTGWIGRALDQQAAEMMGRVPAVAVGIDQTPLSLIAAKVNVPTVGDLSQYELRVGNGPAADQQTRRKLIPQLAQGTAADGSELDFLRRTAQVAFTSAERLRSIAASYQPAASYPNNHLGRSLKLVAQMIAGDLGTRIFFVSLGGFDTHSQQLGAHQALLSELSGAVRAFQQDLQGHQLDDRVLLATFSEFGRRVAENGSLGTDHGAAAPLFVIGPKAKGIHGSHPSLTDLDDGDLKHHTDFRSVYATLLENWLGIPSEPVLGRQCPKLPIM